ncbi:hypothetical protein [Pararhodobacter sp. CCB-MM2]|uniref:hypothetical protein n=1 Tax=Pararhodobacter sp. CCB-MM2 TaxID=1786003 RepID=UPI000833401A|nr:hypothetical protein [Pararhodobacter sp. CCB-MM2]
MRDSRDPTGWRLALITALALIGLTIHAAVTGPEIGLTAPEAAMARIFHAALLALVLFFLTRLSRVTEGRENRRRATGLLLFIAGIAGTGLLLRDFGVI